MGTPYNDDNQRADAGFVYDGDGNPTTYRGYPGFAYDSENRLVQYPATGPATYEAGYNGLGLRAWKRANGGPTTFYLHDGTDVVCELNASGTVTAVNAFGADGLISRWTTARGNVFYAFDPMGNVAQRLSGSGTVLSQDLYDAFGQRIAGGDATDPYGWGAKWGYYMDQETGLVLMTHRHYDPTTGRFLTRDPIGPAGGVNLYAYVGNNPVNWIDPLGLMTEGQYDKIKEVLEYEKKHGTVATAQKFSNTWYPSQGSLGEEFNDKPIDTMYGTIDLDWYTDLMSFNATPLDVDILYVTGKCLWNTIRGKGAPPYGDPKEKAALDAIRNGKRHYRDLFPDEFMEKQKQKLTPSPKSPANGRRGRGKGRRW